MQISPYQEYLVVSRKSETNPNSYSSFIVKGDKLHSEINSLTVDVSPINTYEIYTKCPKTGVSGWDIKHVRSTKGLIRKYPDFDCIITTNDVENTDGDFLDWDKHST